jgi:transcriptional regulator with XRE-family HTH domain
VRKTAITRPSAGGSQLKLLRENRHKTQLEIEMEASLGSGYLQRIESGKVEQPERETLERILAALQASYPDQKAILEKFGYQAGIPMPQAAEIAWAQGLTQGELNQAPFPAYLLDCTHRLLAWNGLLPCLFGRSNLDEFLGYSMMLMVFEKFAALIQNPEAFYPANIRAVHHQMHEFREAKWYPALIEEMRRESHNFRQHWREPEVFPTTAARLLTPLEIQPPDSPRLCFRLTAEPLTQDARFRLMYYLPADAVTLRQCADWVEKIGLE